MHSQTSKWTDGRMLPHPVFPWVANATRLIKMLIISTKWKKGTIFQQVTLIFKLAFFFWFHMGEDSGPTPCIGTKCTHYTDIHSSQKEVHIDFAQFSRWRRVTEPNPGSCQVCQTVLVVICKRPCWKIPYRYLALLRCLSSYHLRKMTSQLKSQINV